MAALTLLAAGCGVGEPAPPPSPADCIAVECATSLPAQSTGPLPSPPIGTPSPAASSAASPASSTPVAFRSEAAALGPVVWATTIDDETRSPLDQVTWIASDSPTIYASVPVERITAGTTVQAQWSYNRTRLESLDQAIVAEQSEFAVWLEFHLALTPGSRWPSGVYDVSLVVDGEPAVTGSVEVGDTPP